MKLIEKKLKLFQVAQILGIILIPFALSSCANVPVANDVYEDPVDEGKSIFTHDG